MSTGYVAEASKPGLGCVTFGREISKDDSFAIMDHAYQAGIDFFDTAAAYGAGASEQIVGEWLAQNPAARNSITVATKILPPYHPAQIRRSVEESLERLRCETIDILYLHRWDERLNDSATWLELSALIKQGKVKALGVSNFNIVQLADTIRLLKSIGQPDLSYIQNNHNLAVSEVTDEIKNLCKQNNIRIVTYSPLGAGFLTGKHLHGIAKDSRFAIMPAHQDIYFKEHAQKRLHWLLEVASRTGYAPELLALAWATHQQGVYSVLVGGRTINHLDLALKAMQFYDREIFAELERFK
jgi:aryl-alcohol dehydrogenase-like predicted oxidoreductase